MLYVFQISFQFVICPKTLFSSDFTFGCVSRKPGPDVARKLKKLALHILDILWKNWVKTHRWPYRSIGKIFCKVYTERVLPSNEKMGTIMEASVLSVNLDFFFCTQEIFLGSTELGWLWHFSTFFLEVTLKLQNVLLCFLDGHYFLRNFNHVRKLRKEIYET